MGRPTKGWRIDWHGGVYRVRFTVPCASGRGRVFEGSTGITDRGQRAAAERQASEIYAREVRRGPGERQQRASPAQELAPWVAAWAEDTAVRPITRELYDRYGGYWAREFSSTAALTEIRIVQYVRRRLGEVTGKSVRNELSALRGFLAYLVEAKMLLEAPAVPTVKASVGGTRWPQRRRTRAPALSPSEVRALLAALPEKSNREGWPIRARFVVEYETTLRPQTLDLLEAPRNYSRGAKTIVLTDDQDKELYGREVPLSLKARRALDRVCPAEGLIFGWHRHDPYLHEAARQVLDPQKASIFTGQHFRSAAITHLLERSGNMPGVQYLAGHKHASTTARYVRPSFRAALAVIGKR